MASKLGVVFLAVVALGCAHGNKRSEEEREAKAAPNTAVLAKLKAIKPGSAGSGVVVLYRNTRFGGMFGPMTFNGTLWLDEQAIGDVSDDKYNVIELPAGRHSLRVLGTAAGIMVPLQATTVVNVADGATQFLELNSVQEFSNVTLKFRPGASPEVIAVDCTEGFTLDLTPDDGPPRPATTSRM
jgi:hypothetical protein